eukprot:403367292
MNDSSQQIKEITLRKGPPSHHPNSDKIIANNNLKGMFTQNQVKEMLQDEQNQKLQLLNNNFQLQKKQALEYFKNNYVPQSARNADNKIINQFSQRQQQDLNNPHFQTQVSNNNNGSNTRNFHLNIQDTSHNDENTGDVRSLTHNHLKNVIKTVTIDSNDHQNLKSQSRISDQPKSTGMYNTQSALSTKLQNYRNGLQSAQLNKNSATPLPEARQRLTSDKNQLTQRKSPKISNIQDSSIGGGPSMHYNSFGPENNSMGSPYKIPSMKSTQDNQIRPSVGGQNQNYQSTIETMNSEEKLDLQRMGNQSERFNPNTATYKQSLLYYETQYKEKVRELDFERKSKRKLEDRVDELEQALHQLIDENQKLRDELTECMSDNKVLSDHFQVVQDQNKVNEPYTNEVEEKNIQLNLEIYTLKEETKLILEERAQAQRKSAQLQFQIDQIANENKKWKEQNDQLKERMQSLRSVNKQMENKANKNMVMLRRDDIFKDCENRMIKAEGRVKELEESLSQFIEDFETLNGDLTICAQKLALAEGRVETLNKQNQELEVYNSEILEKLSQLDKLTPSKADVSLSAHLDQSQDSNKRFDAEEVMKMLDTQNLQILTLTKTLESLRKENREQFQKTLEQQESIFNLQSKIQSYENHFGGGYNNFLGGSSSSLNKDSQVMNSISGDLQRPLAQSNDPQVLKIEFNRSSQYTLNQHSQELQMAEGNQQPSPRTNKYTSLQSSQDPNYTQRNKLFHLQQTFGGGSYNASSNNEYELNGLGGGASDSDNLRSSNAVRSAVKEFSFKNQSRDIDPNKIYEKFNNVKDKHSSLNFNAQNSAKKTGINHNRTSNLDASQQSSAKKTAVLTQISL